jgi:hypothetical protein
MPARRFRRHRPSAGVPGGGPVFGDTEALRVTLAVMALPLVVERQLEGHAA